MTAVTLLRAASVALMAVAWWVAAGGASGGEVAAYIVGAIVLLGQAVVVDAVTDARDGPSRLVARLREQSRAGDDT